MRRTLLSIAWLLSVLGVSAQSAGSNDLDFNPGDEGLGIGDPAPAASAYTYSTVTLNCMATDAFGRTIWSGSSQPTPNPASSFLQRRNADGTPDPTFSTVSWNITGYVYAIAVQADGKILLGGNFSTSSNVGNRLNLVRLNDDGSVDQTFANSTSWGTGSPVVRALVVQPDGRILVGGTFSQYSGFTVYNLMRLNSDGTRHTGWSSGASGGSVNGAVHALVLQPDGRVLVAGDFLTAGGSSRPRIARFDASGWLDTTFNPGTGCDAVVRTLVRQPDGKVLLGGDMTNFNGTACGRIARLSTAGALDALFLSSPAFNGAVRSLALRTNGSILAAGDFTMHGSTARNRVAVVGVNGLLDNTFVPGGGPNGPVTAVHARTDGTALVIGSFTSVSNIAARRHARLTASGGVDLTYCGNGFDGTTTALAVEDGGTVLIGGDFTAYNGSGCSHVVRLLADNTLDPGFTCDLGYMSLIEIGAFAVNDLVVQPDGRILAAGILAANWSDLFGPTGFGMGRMLPNGDVDPSFTAATPAYQEARAMSLQDDGRIIAANNNYYARNQPASYSATLKRYNADGSVDASFQSGTSANRLIRATAVLPDGRVFVVGDFNNYAGSGRNHLLRLNSDGTVDTGFNYAAGFGGGTPLHVLTYPDGHCILSGSFTSYDGQPANGLVRLNADGSMDASFAPTIQGGGPVIRGNEGKLIVSGQYRLNEDGSTDAAFLSGSGSSTASGPSLPIATAAHEGGILAIGAFTAFNGIGRNRIARIHEVVLSDITLPVRALLEGPFVEATNLMNDGLRVAGLIPASEPYSALGFAHVAEPPVPAVDPAVFTVTMPPFGSIVDWVMVELRSAADPQSVVQTRTGLIQRDGDIVGTDGVSSLVFRQPLGDYHVAVRHRNHLGAMTATPVTLSTSNALLDLSLPTTATHGGEAQKALGMRMVLWAGDAAHNGSLKYTGSSNDRDPILVKVGSTTPNASEPGYFTEDVNLDGTVRYTGSGNDRDPILVNVGSTTPNIIRQAQLP